MAVFATITVTELRKAYNAGKATGNVNVATLGLTYAGKAIAVLSFQRNAVIDYVDAGGKRIGRFQDMAEIDD